MEKGDIVLQFVESDLHLADFFMKPLDSSRFTALRRELGGFVSLWLTLRGSLLGSLDFFLSFCGFRVLLISCSLLTRLSSLTFYRSSRCWAP